MEHFLLNLWKLWLAKKVFTFLYLISSVVKWFQKDMTNYSSLISSHEKLLQNICEFGFGQTLQIMFVILFFILFFCRLQVFQKAIICFARTIISISKVKYNMTQLKMHNSSSNLKLQAELVQNSSFRPTVTTKCRLLEESHKIWI